MKKIGLLGLLLIGSARLMAQDRLQLDSLSSTLKMFKSPSQSFKLPNALQLNPNQLGAIPSFKYPDGDTLNSLQGFTVANVKHSPIDHMPIADLPNNSKMPIYKLPRSTDNMPGSNPPATVAPVAPPQ